MRITQGLALCLLLLSSLGCMDAQGRADRFSDLGVATPVSSARGIVATADGQGRDVVLAWLYDHRGGYALLMIDAQTGRSEQFPIPFDPGHDGPYSSILSSRGKFYTLFNSHFCEFDPAARAFTFSHITSPQMAMGMTEDDNGVIWAVTYPQSGVISFNPITRQLNDYGYVYRQNWAQYQRYVAADSAGWIYFAIGSAASQIVAFDPRTRQASPMFPESDRVKGTTAYLYRDLDGKVYGRPTLKGDWYEFYRGQGRKIGAVHQAHPKPIITNAQDLFYPKFPDGQRLKSCNTVERLMVVEDPATGQSRQLRFNYTSEGANLMNVVAAPDGAICGGSTFPMRFFSYNPATNQWINRDSYGQWNTLARLGDHMFIGGYTNGYLLDWDPARPWVPTVKNKPGCNPLFLTECTPVIDRPYRLLACPDGRTLVLAGAPDYGYTGGGLLFWDTQLQQGKLLTDSEVIPNQSTISLLALPDGRLLGGTTTAPGTGGEKKAREAVLYLLDMATKQVQWRWAVLPGIQEYTDLLLTPSGLVFGIADQHVFFVLDPATRRIIAREDLAGRLGHTTSQQGPRVFVTSPSGEIFILMIRGIAQVNPRSLRISMLAWSPVPIGPGGDWLDGSIYFASGSHVYRYKLREPLYHPPPPDAPLPATRANP